MGKTGTTFLQRRCFSKLDEKAISFNPPIISSELHTLCALTEIKQTSLLECKRNIEAEVEKIVADKIFISNESILNDGWMISFNPTLDVLKFLFPDAKIILGLRHQVSWCQSLYLEAIHQGVISRFDDFLNFKDGEYQDRGDSQCSTNVHRLQLPLLVESCMYKFSKQNVLVYFFEDFRKDAKNTVCEIFEFFGSTVPEVDYSPERKGLSTLSATIILYYQKFLRIFGHGIPYSTRTDNLSPYEKLALISLKKSYKNIHFYKIILIIFSKSWYRFQTNFNTLVGFRNILQSNVDRLIYINWNIWKPRAMHQKLIELAEEQNKNMPNILPLEQIPDIYLNMSQINSKIIGKRRRNLLRGE
jgi:hypothetical protein